MAASQRLNNIPKLKDAIKKITRLEIRIGVPDGEMHKVQNEGEKPVSLVKIAFENEFGTSRIPERSFLRSSFSENKAQIVKYKKQILRSIILGNTTPIEGAHVLGLFIAGLVKQKIYKGLQPPLSPITLANRFHKDGAKSYDEAGLRNETLIHLAAKNANNARSPESIKSHIREFKNFVKSGSKDWDRVSMMRAQFVGQMVDENVFTGLPLIDTGQFVQSISEEVIYK